MASKLEKKLEFDQTWRQHFGRLDHDPSSLSAAQLSRSAAQAIRHLMREPGTIPQALYLVKSLVYSAKPRSQRPPPNPESTLAPVDFRRTVSPRLSAHTVLHALIRSGRAMDTTRVAEWMMEQGIVVHSKTRELLILQLRSQSSFAPPQRTHWKYSAPRVPEGPEVLTLGRGMVADQCTAAAIQLIMKAHEYGHAHTRRTINTIIHWCLLQGEIIVGSLLFVLLVKHLQMRQAAGKASIQAEQQKATGCREKDSVVDPIAWERLRKMMGPRDAWPSSKTMKPILDSIRNALADRPPEQYADALPLRLPLQALANLAMLLDTGQLRQQHISAFVQVLYSCPRTNEKVWILNRRGYPAQVEAYSYFHSVLKRICNTYGMNGTSPPRKLCRRSYNALLHYALRHQMSPELASPILQHMCIHRDPPLRPNIVTCNILLRSAALLRKQSLSQPVLSMLARFPGVQAALFKDPSRAPPATSTSAVPPLTPVSSFFKAVQRLRKERLATPTNFYGNALAADMHTVTTFIKYLTSTGRPQYVANVLFIILPELGVVDHPTWSSARARAYHIQSRESREQALRRVTTYGPHFFAVVIDALVKAGRTGLAERLWQLAKQAERMSWDPELGLRIKPWFLPVEAYTTMLQNYCNERHKAEKSRAETSTKDEFEDPGWRPVAPENINGWAKFSLGSRQLHTMHSSLDIGRRELTLKKGLLLMRSMMSGGRAVWKALLAMQEQSPETAERYQIPRPDARFFNAALRLFGRDVYSSRQPRRRKRLRWQEKLWRAHRGYQIHGRLSPQWTPMLQEAAEHMVAAGHSVPLGYRRLFIGRWTPGTVYVGEPPRHPGVRPRLYPRYPSRNVRPHALPTIKTRGLPLGRTTRSLRGDTPDIRYNVLD
ncbi:hypothetical protein CERSUDRAFT_100060 [Gelatoporia subvermispora B]|uniref:Uncharacterized protein n=1 Tax=Ceriporiopsis subvermispora (strain B) TaxID=914234 RepID=M2QIB0_CERS8|nr:hypothetical protein CERSUDRAFT_100060 [Gelatoporia subvermispora B]